MNVVLYTTHCPRCTIIEKKLQQKGIEFTEFSDLDQMLAMGFKEAPKLEVDGQIMDFKTANEWIKEQ